MAHATDQRSDRAVEKGRARPWDTDRKRRLQRTTSGARLPLLVIAAIRTSVTLELVRTIGALLEVGFDIGVEAAAGMALAACVGAAIPGGLLCALGRRRSGSDVLAIGVVALAMMRLFAQGLTGDARVIVGLTAITTGIAVLVLAVAVLAAAETGATAA